MRAHESNLILHDGAKRKLKQMGLGPSKADPRKIQKDIEKLEETRKQLSSRVKTMTREASLLEKKMEEILKYINPESHNSQAKTMETPKPHKSNLRS